MESTVEAQSLSSLTRIAANPPVRLERSSSGLTDSMVLYIARVPGSRDVFLTPLKPRKRVVTAEDVQSSLYYFHVNHADDKLLASLIEETDKVKERKDEDLRAELATVRKRKPVGSQRKFTHSNSQVHERVRNSERLSAIPPRKPIGDDLRANQKMIYTSVKTDITALSPRRATALNKPSLSGGHLHQPRSLQEENIRPNTGVLIQSNVAMETKRTRLQNNDLQLINTPENRSRSTNDKWHNSFSTMEGFGDELNGTHRPTVYSALEDQLRSGHSEGTPSNYDGDLHITMIRRDPASGTQWNVGKIIDPSSADVSLEALHNYQESQRGNKTDGPFFVELYTPGYEKFISDSELREQCSSSATSQERANREWQPNSTEYDESHSRPKGVFKRRLWMESSRLGKTEKVQRGPKRKIFAFFSPWNGRCEFSTGLDGDSLRCRHSSLRNGLSSPIDDANVVSELRFNLPTIRVADRSTTNNYSNLLRERHSTQNPTHRKFNSLSSIATIATFRSSSISSHTNSLDRYNNIRSPQEHNDERAQAFSQHSQHERHDHQRHHSLHDPQSIPIHESLDLSLAQENAGGGFAGRQAKLGKLIVHDEGLKMFDLLVAANMGIWWRAYERTDGASE